MEEWREIPEFDGVYAVSNIGRVKRLVHDARSGAPAGLIRKLQKLGQTGYLAVDLKRDGKQRLITVHRLVMRAFVGPAPDGFHVNHKDGIKTNNLLENLEYVTPKQNAIHARDVLHVPKAHGETHCCARLSSVDIDAIRHLAKLGIATKAIAARYAVCVQHVRRVIRGVARKHG